MRSLLLAFLLAVLLPLAACGDVGDAPVAETTTATAADTASVAAPASGVALPLDTAATRIEWTGAKVVGSHDGGFRRFRGTITLDGEAVAGADVVIDAASIYTDNARLETHLRSDDFFGVEAYPEARFRVTALEPIAPADTAGAAGATHRVTGLLTLRDRTNQVVFPAAVRVAADAVTAEADFIIDRQLWGLSYPGQPDNLIQDEIRIRLHAVAPRTGSPAEAGSPALP
jgi:polyisoprenoid-binding protein YceI